MSEGKIISSATPRGSCCKRTKSDQEDQCVESRFGEDQEGSEWAWTIEKEQMVAI